MIKANNNLTAKSEALFLLYARNAGNWGGSPLWDEQGIATKSDLGNLTDLKKKGLLDTDEDDGRGDIFIHFTADGIALAAEHGIEI